MDYRSVEWHTGSDGKIHEVAVEYNQTLLQWLFRKPATTRRWYSRNGKEWYVVLDDDIDGAVSRSLGKKDVEELMKAMDYIIRQKALQDLEDRCRKILQGE